MDKWIDATTKGLSNAEANKVAGYSKSYDPMKSTIAKITVEEAFAMEGMDNHYFAKFHKNVMETAEKGIATPNGIEYMPDWQNRMRAAELWARSTDKLSATKSKIEVDVNMNPYAKLSDEELDKQIILEGEIAMDDKYSLIKGTDNGTDKS